MRGKIKTRGRGKGVESSEIMCARLLVTRRPSRESNLIFFSVSLSLSSHPSSLLRFIVVVVSEGGRYVRKRQRKRHDTQRGMIIYSQ